MTTYQPITSSEWEDLARGRCYQSSKEMLLDLYYRRGNGLSTLAHIFNVPMKEVREKLKELDLPIREGEKGGDSVSETD